MAVKQFNVGVVDAKTARRTGVATYGTAYDLIAIDNFEITVNVASAELPGDGGIVDIFSRATKLTIKAKFGFHDLAALSAITGQSLSSTASYDHIKLDTIKMPYFGMAFEMEHSDGNGNTVVFIPKMKIVSDFVSFSAGQVAYVTNEVTATAVKENTLYGMAGARQASELISLDNFPPWVS